MPCRISVRNPEYWYCCLCKDGPHNLAINAHCSLCYHPRCSDLSAPASDVPFHSSWAETASRSLARQEPQERGSNGFGRNNGFPLTPSYEAAGCIDPAKLLPSEPIAITEAASFDDAGTSHHVFSIPSNTSLASCETSSPRSGQLSALPVAAGPGGRRSKRQLPITDSLVATIHDAKANEVQHKRQRSEPSVNLLSRLSSFACPFFKHDRGRFKNPKWKLCGPQPGTAHFPDTHRVKEHLDRHHCLKECEECNRIFKGKHGLAQHKRAGCESQVKPLSLDGTIAFEMQKCIRSKEGLTNLSEPEKWNKIYTNIFGEEGPIPNYYYEGDDFTPYREWHPAEHVLFRIMASLDQKQPDLLGAIVTEIFPHGCKRDVIGFDIVQEMLSTLPLGSKNRAFLDTDNIATDWVGGESGFEQAERCFDLGDTLEWSANAPTGGVDVVPTLASNRPLQLMEPTLGEFFTDTLTMEQSTLSSSLSHVEHRLDIGGHLMQRRTTATIPHASTPLTRAPASVNRQRVMEVLEYTSERHQQPTAEDDAFVTRELAPLSGDIENYPQQQFPGAMTGPSLY